MGWDIRRGTRVTVCQTLRLTRGYRMGTSGEGKSWVERRRRVSVRVRRAPVVEVGRACVVEMATSARVKGVWSSWR